jgi:Gas vesicle synthesis protein GvpL/GvpF
MPDLMALHLYAVVRSVHPVRPGLRGVGDPPGPVSLVSASRLAAAVSPIDAGGELSESDATRHLDVLVELLRDGPVLPVRFGTVSPDAEAIVEEILTPAADDLAAQLDAVDGFVELRLAVAADENAEIATVVQDLPDLHRWSSAAMSTSMADRIEFGELIEARLRARREQRNNLIAQRLAPRSSAVRDLSNDDPTASKVAFLVRESELDNFDSAVAAVLNELGSGYEADYTGPFPAVDFVELGGSGPHQQPRWGWSGTDTTGKWGW